MAQKPTQNRPSNIGGRVNRDTIVRTRTLVAKGRKSTADVIREKARETERAEKERKEQERKKELAARKKKYEKQQRRREIAMFLVVLVLVGGIFLTDALTQRNKEKAPEQPIAEEPAQPVGEAASLAELNAPPPDEEAEEEPAEPVTEEPQEEAATEEAEEEAPVVEEDPFPDVLAEYQSEGRGTDNRVNNLTRACEAIHAYVLEPGEQFSFNEVLGERTEERGYLPASIYTAEEDNLALGGGICQVASTLYLCALKSGLQIDERLAHFYTVDYVPYGLDATIDWGNIDLKFTNSLQHPIMIRAEVTYLGVYVRILGTDEDDTYIELTNEIVNTYEFDTFKQVNYSKDVGYTNWLTLPKNGYDVISYQDIYSADGELIEHREVAKSFYQKIDLIIEVGPYT